MTDIVELDEHRPHISGPVVCTRCRHKWAAVRPIGTDLLECPACGASRGASLDTMLHKPHLILGAECCGQRDGDGVCAAPACLYGDALTLVQCLRDASHLEYPALRAENERLPMSSGDMTNEQLREAVARLLNASCFEGCEPGDDELRACTFPPCRCRTTADAAMALMRPVIRAAALEEAVQALYGCTRFDQEIFDSIAETRDGTYIKIDDADAAIRALATSKES